MERTERFLFAKIMQCEGRMASNSLFKRLALSNQEGVCAMSGIKQPPRNGRQGCHHRGNLLRHLLCHKLCLYASWAGDTRCLWILMPGFIALFTGIPYLMMCASAEGGFSPADGPYHRADLLRHRPVHPGNPGLLCHCLRPGGTGPWLYPSIPASGGNLVSFVLFSRAWWALRCPSG